MPTIDDIKLIQTNIQGLLNDIKSLETDIRGYLETNNTSLSNMNTALTGNSANAIQYLLTRMKGFQDTINVNTKNLLTNASDRNQTLLDIKNGLNTVGIENFPTNFPDTDVKNLITTLNTKIDNITGGSTPAITTLSGSKVEEQLTQSNAISNTLTFSDNIYWIGIYNTDVVNDGVFTVNGIAITVPKGESFQDGIGGTVGKTVSVTGSTSYIVTRYV